MYVFLTLSEFAEFMNKNYGIIQPYSHYRYLAQTEKLRDATKKDDHWVVKIKTSAYMIDDIEDVFEELAKTKERLNSIEKICKG